MLFRFYGLSENNDVLGGKKQSGDLRVVWYIMRNLQNQFKMNKYFVLIAAFGMISMASCTPAKKESKPVQVQQQNQEPQSLVQSDTTSIILSVPEPIPATAISKEPTVVNASVTPPKLNPPHGQPFHRCDIAVGSPLNAAAPAKSASTTISTGTSPTLENAARLNNPQANTAPTPSAPTVVNATPPKLNPPHGQPFHRCEIPVGSPLN